jgi:hypothetical protein
MRMENFPSNVWSLALQSVFIDSVEGFLAELNGTGEMNLKGLAFVNGWEKSPFTTFIYCRSHDP